MISFCRFFTTYPIGEVPDGPRPVDADADRSAGGRAPLTPSPRLDPVFVELRKRDSAASRGAARSISDVCHLAKIC